MGYREVIDALPQRPSGYAISKQMRQSELRADCSCRTDPPYYDNIGYADLSDFFYVWLRRSLGRYIQIFSARC